MTTEAMAKSPKTKAKKGRARAAEPKPATAVTAEAQPGSGAEVVVEQVEPPKSETGRPSSFKPEYIAAVETICARGATDVEIAEFFEVTPRTVSRWKLQHEEFCLALKTGKDIADERVQRSLFQRASGFAYVEQQAFKIKTIHYADNGKKLSETEEIKIVDVERQAPPDTTAGIFWLKNRRKEEWRDVQSKEHSGPNGGPIEVSEAPRSPGDDRLAEMGDRYGKRLTVIAGGKA